MLESERGCGPEQTTYVSVNVCQMHVIKHGIHILFIIVSALRQSSFL